MRELKQNSSRRSTRFGQRKSTEPVHKPSEVSSSTPLRQERSKGLAIGYRVAVLPEEKSCWEFAIFVPVELFGPTIADQEGVLRQICCEIVDEGDRYVIYPLEHLQETKDLPLMMFGEEGFSWEMAPDHVLC